MHLCERTDLYLNLKIMIFGRFGIFTLGVLGGWVCNLASFWRKLWEGSICASVAPNRNEINMRDFLTLPTYLWKLELGTWTYGLKSLYQSLKVFMGINGPYQISRPQTHPRSRYFLRFDKFYCIQLTILDKTRSCLWKLELRFWTYVG